MANIVVGTAFVRTGLAFTNASLVRISLLVMARFVKVSCLLLIESLYYLYYLSCLLLIESLYYCCLFGVIYTEIVST